VLADGEPRRRRRQHERCIGELRNPRDFVCRELIEVRHPVDARPDVGTEGLELED